MDGLSADIVPLSTEQDVALSDTSDEGVSVRDEENTSNDYGTKKY